MVVEKTLNNRTIKVVSVNSSAQAISSQDSEMDNRAIKAVKAAVEKAAVCKKPIAKYDIEKKKAYIQYANGDIEYVD